MVVNSRPLKRMRRRVSADLPDFFNFPVAGDAVPDGPFRSTVRCFLQRHARPALPPSLFSCLTTWQILFRIGDDLVDGGDGQGPAVVALDIVEEDVSRSRSVYCDQCRVVGWSRHPVCRKKYHFIIRSGASSNGLAQKKIAEQGGGRDYDEPCTTCACGNLLHPWDSRCNSCDSENTEDGFDFEDAAAYRQFLDSTHLLHGVVHSNGYGHLLTLNGREGGSTILCGREIMNFWDKLCKTLSVRKVSVMDVSRKCGMEYRLLHAITNGHPWYGNWGYEFGNGSYALTLHAYKNAVETLANIPLSLFSFQGRGPQTDLQAIIAFYQSLSDSKLVSLRDLFSFVSRLIHESHGPINKETIDNPKCPTTMLCNWTRNDVECVEQAMIKVLQAKAASGDTSWVSRRALKGALCKATSPELLDYCLKKLGEKIAANRMVVNRRCNPSSAAVEYRLEPLGFVHNQTRSNSNHPSQEYLIRDLKYLYDCILHPQTMLNYRPREKRELVIDSANKVIDCKQFVKDYKPDKMATANPFAIYLWCHAEVEDHPKDDPATPPELLILPQNASVADFKLEATKVFQEVYLLYKRFEADQLLEYGPLDDSMTMKLLVGSTGSVRVRGRCLGIHGLSRFRMERGTEEWTVDCTCGAKDDDGEQMLACDACSIWQHTRCAGIDNNDDIQCKFVCTGCLNSYREESNNDAEYAESAKMPVMFRSGTCRKTTKISCGPTYIQMVKGSEWKVDCTCGAKDDDGERMMTCDTCGISQHTKCAGFDNHDEIQAKFICTRCLDSYVDMCNNVAKCNELAKMEMILSGRKCREAAKVKNSEIGSTLIPGLGIPLM